MDAITLLKQDHKTVSQLFREFEKAKKADDPGRADIVATIIEELSVHTVIEEDVFYPKVRAEIPDLTDDLLESVEEHHVVKWLCNELMHLDVADERYDAKVTVLKEAVEHHVEEEEKEWFPKVREEMGRKQLGEIGEQLEAAKQDAPREPRLESVVGSKP